MSQQSGKKSLRSRTIKGVLWSAFDSLSGLAVQMICSLIVARLLTPKDFGIVGMITVFSAIGLIIIDSGFGQALIRKQNTTDVDFSSVFFFNLIISIFVYILLYLLSPLIETFYNIHGLCKISRTVFLIIPINAIGLIQNTILTKKVDFKTLGIISFTSSLLSGGVGIILAYYLQNVWAIVYQMLTMYLLRAILLWIFAKWKPMLTFSFLSIKEMSGYASNLLFTGLFGTIVNNISPLVIGKVYDATQLGYYTQADKLQKIPSTTSTSIIQRVTFPILVEIQYDNQRLRAAYCKILAQAVYFISPIMVLLSTLSPEIINILLGPKWMTSARYLQILCISGLLYPISCLTLNIINIKGKTRLLFYLEVVRKIIFFLIIIISMQFSIEVFIWMQAFYAVIQLVINLYYSGKQIELKVVTQLKVALPIIFFSIICCIPSLIITYFLEISELISLFMYLTIYAFVFLGLSKKLELSPYKECEILFKKIIKK